MLFSFNTNAQQNDDEVTAASRTAEKLNRASNSTTVISDQEINNKKTFNVLGLLITLLVLTFQDKELIVLIST